MYLAQLPQGITRFRGFKPAPVSRAKAVEDYPYVDRAADVMARYWENHRAMEFIDAMHKYPVVVYRWIDGTMRVAAQQQW